MCGSYPKDPEPAMKECSQWGKTQPISFRAEEETEANYVAALPKSQLEIGLFPFTLDDDGRSPESLGVGHKPHSTQGLPSVLRENSGSLALQLAAGSAMLWFKYVTTGSCFQRFQLVALFWEAVEFWKEGPSRRI